MSRRLVAICVLATVVPLTALSAPIYYFPGQSFLTGGDHDDTGLLSSGGVLTPSIAICPVGGLPTNALSIVNTEIVYSDYETAGDVACYWAAQNWDTSLYLSSTMHSSATYGGTPSPVLGPTGIGYVGVGELRWDNPVNRGQLLYPLSVVAHCTLWGGERIHSYNLTSK